MNPVLHDAFAPHLPAWWELPLSVAIGTLIPFVCVWLSSKHAQKNNGPYRKAPPVEWLDYEETGDREES